MRNADVRGSRVAIIADAIVNRFAPGSAGVVDRLIELGYGFLVMPTHEFAVASTPTSVEFIVDDAVDYRRFGYEVIIVSAGDLPGRGVWSDLVDADLARRSEAPFPELDVADALAVLADVVPAT